MGPERKLYAKIKKSIPQISWIRLENLSLSGTPDLLGYNDSGHFFTVELKVTKSNKVRFSPHQIAFHVKHPKNSFIMVEHLGQRSVKLFPGSGIKALDAWGLSLGAGNVHLSKLEARTRCTHLHTAVALIGANDLIRYGRRVSQFRIASALALRLFITLA